MLSLEKDWSVFWSVSIGCLCYPLNRSGENGGSGNPTNDLLLAEPGERLQNKLQNDVQDDIFEQ